MFVFCSSISLHAWTGENYINIQKYAKVKKEQVSQENRGHVKKRYSSAKSNKKQVSPAEASKSK